MFINKEKYYEILKKLNDSVTLVAVSKTKPIETIQSLYDLGQRDFGENYVQELVEKQDKLPKDIHWHFIGHLQSNKVKYIASFIHLIHSVDSLNLLKEINKQAKKHDRVINCLLQIHIAKEETKFGLGEKELVAIINSDELKELKNVKIIGLMGIASFTNDFSIIRKEFQYLKDLYDKSMRLSTIKYHLSTLSIGMSSDYEIALQEGSNMIRIGSLIFGSR